MESNGSRRETNKTRERLEFVVSPGSSERRRLLLRLQDEKIALDNNWIAWSYNFHLLNLQIRQTKHEAWPESERKCQTKHTKMLFLTNRS